VDVWKGAEVSDIKEQILMSCVNCGGIGRELMTQKTAKPATMSDLGYKSLDPKDWKVEDVYLYGQDEKGKRIFGYDKRYYEDGTMCNAWDAGEKIDGQVGKGDGCTLIRQNGVVKVQRDMISMDGTLSDTEGNIGSIHDVGRYQKVSEGMNMPRVYAKEIRLKYGGTHKVDSKLQYKPDYCAVKHHQFTNIHTHEDKICEEFFYHETQAWLWKYRNGVPMLEGSIHQAREIEVFEWRFILDFCQKIDVTLCEYEVFCTELEEQDPKEYRIIYNFQGEPIETHVSDTLKKFRMWISLYVLIVMEDRAYVDLVWHEDGWKKRLKRLDTNARKRLRKLHELMKDQRRRLERPIKEMLE